MAWQAYVDQMTSAGVQIGGIFGQDGNEWAAVSPKLKPSPQEVIDIVNGVRAQSFENGVRVGGEKFTVVRIEDRSVSAKRTAAKTDDEKYLLHACLGTCQGMTCILIGGTCGPAERSMTGKLEDLRDWLEKSN